MQKIHNILNNIFVCLVTLCYCVKGTVIFHRLRVLRPIQTCEHHTTTDYNGMQTDKANVGYLYSHVS